MSTARTKHSKGGVLPRIGVSNFQPPRGRRRVPAKYIERAIRAAKATCPLSDVEIGDWTKKLTVAGHERQLKRSITFWYMQAARFIALSSASMEGRRRDYVKRRLELGDEPTTIEFPRHLDRPDKWLSSLATRLTAIRLELASLPDELQAGLRLSSNKYQKTLDEIDVLAVALQDVANIWHRPRAGQPSFESESYAIELLVCAIEDVTGEVFPSPRSPKRMAEIELVHMLAARLFPTTTSPNIRTMLRLFHNRRLRGRVSASTPAEY